MNFDYPKLTAYALDELDEAERSIIDRAIAESPEAHRFIADTQMLARVLKSEFGRELEIEIIGLKKLELSAGRIMVKSWSACDRCPPRSLRSDQCGRVEQS